MGVACSTHGTNPVVVLLPPSASNRRGPPVVGKESVQHHPDSFRSGFTTPDTFKNVGELTDNRKHRSADLPDLLSR